MKLKPNNIHNETTQSGFWKAANAVKRFRQAYSNTFECLDHQNEQLKLIRKLYARHSLSISGGSAFPENYTVTRGGIEIAHYWLRYGEFTVEVRGKIIHTDQPYGDGMFEPEERFKYLCRAMRLVLAENP